MPEIWGTFGFQKSQFGRVKIGLLWQFLAFLSIFCVLDFNQNIRHQGLVNVIRVNGVVLPQR